MQLREFNPNDYEMVCKWWEAHGSERLPMEMLPKLGIVVCKDEEPMAALWLYMDNSVGVCFMERVVTKPKLKLTEARDAVLFGIGFLKQRAAAMDYGAMFIRTYPALAKYLKRIGFVSDPRPVECLFSLTRGANA